MSQIRVVRVNHVALSISDRHKTLPFYRDLLGLKVIPSMVDSPNVVWAAMEDGTMVHPVEPPPDGRASVPHVAFEVADFDGTIAALREAGVEIIRDGVRHDGQRFLFVDDPDGNRIELVTKGGEPPANRKADEWGYTRVE